ncbi:MAG: hypothetical protein FH753_12490 [Firmicutes bacterium]|nr:hypothetical protein [Bacillota bacterium]
MNKYIKYSWLLLGVTVILNIFFYNFLPEKIDLLFSFKFSFKPRLGVNKIKGLILVPIVMVITNIVSQSKLHNENKKIFFILNVFLFLINLVGVLIINL